MEQTGKTLLNSIYDNIIRDMRIVLALFYAFAVGIGMLFAYFRYAQFGINIFEYADLFDFLITPFSDYRIILFAAVSLVLAYGFIVFDSMWKRKFPRSYTIANFGLPKTPFFKFIRSAAYIFIIIFYLFVSAMTYGRVTRERVLKQPSIELRFFDDEIKEGKMIGKTKDVIFLLIDDSTTAIPTTSLVKEIRVKH
ncbi:MAG: hypothetical protein RG741_06705 [Bacteroidales bacterium]|nr:hypothetical protein [Bacteroidales bacterium]